MAGRLRPGKDSAPGMAALRWAVSAGVRQVHSNPKLGTQWAIRRVLDSMPDVGICHLVKAEAPLDAHPATMRAIVRRAIDDSRATLGVQQLHALVLEIDLKRTQDRAILTEPHAVQAFYATAATEAVQCGQIDRVIAYCHSPAHLAAALGAEGVRGVAAQYNVAEPWPALFLDDLEHRGLPFTGMSPLRRGTLAWPSMGVPDGGTRSLAALRWVAADPRVSTIVITMSSLPHARQVVGAMREPLPAASVPALATAWLTAASPAHSPGGNTWSPADRLVSLSQPASGGTP